MLALASVERQLGTLAEEDLTIILAHMDPTSIVLLLCLRTMFCDSVFCVCVFKALQLNFVIYIYIYYID